jgi:hypothetical protein
LDADGSGEIIADNSEKTHSIEFPKRVHLKKERRMLNCFYIDEGDDAEGVRARGCLQQWQKGDNIHPKWQKEYQI